MSRMDKLSNYRSTTTRMTAVPTDLQYRVTAPMTPEKGDAVSARIPAYARSVVRLYNDDGTVQLRAHENEAHHVRAAIREYHDRAAVRAAIRAAQAI